MEPARPGHFPTRPARVPARAAPPAGADRRSARGGRGGAKPEPVPARIHSGQSLRSELDGRAAGVGRAEQLRVGRAEQLGVGRAEQLGVGRAEQLGVGRAEQLEVGRAEQLRVGRAETNPLGCTSGTIRRETSETVNSGTKVII